MLIPRQSTTQARSSLGPKLSSIWLMIARIRKNQLMPLKKKKMKVNKSKNKRNRQMHHRRKPMEKTEKVKKEMMTKKNALEVLR